MSKKHGFLSRLQRDLESPIEVRGFGSGWFSGFFAMLFAIICCGMVVALLGGANVQLAEAH